MEASVKVFTEASVEIFYVEFASVEASVEVVSVEVASVEASVEVSFVEASVKLLRWNLS